MKKAPEIITLAVGMAAFYAVSQLVLVGLLGFTQGQVNTMLLCLIISHQLERPTGQLPEGESPQ